MALFKILKGPEKKDAVGHSVMLTGANGAPPFHEGWAYVTDEGNLYVDLSNSKRVKINSNADLATQAVQDSLGQDISATYIKNLAITTTGTTSTITATKGNNINFDLELPIAGPTSAGLVTNAAQTIAGEKKFNNNIIFSQSNTSFKGIMGYMADNDVWRVGGAGDAHNAGYLEIATGDDTNEPIYVRQYFGTFATLKRTLTLLDGNGNTQIPGNLGVRGTADISGKLTAASTFQANSNATFNGPVTTNAAFTANEIATFFSKNDSTYSKDTNASVVVLGGLTTEKQISAKTVRVDNNQQGKGCVMQFNETSNCLEFVFD